MGVSRDSDIRIKSGIKYALSFFAGEGNTYMPRIELCDRVCELLDVPEELIEESLIEMAFDGTLKIDRLDTQEVCISIQLFQRRTKGL